VKKVMSFFVDLGTMQEILRVLYARIEAAVAEDHLVKEVLL